MPPPPQYRNAQLEERINKKGNDSSLNLCYIQLTNEDMEIVAYYAIQNNEVSIKMLCSAFDQTGYQRIGFKS